MRQGRFECANGLFNESGPVIERDNGDFGNRTIRQGFPGKATLNLFDFVFHIIDYFHGIRSVPGHHNGSDRFSTTLVKSATTGSGSKVHMGHIFNPHRHIIPDSHNGNFEITEVFHITQSTDDIFHIIQFHGLGPDIQIAFPDCIHDLHHRYFECFKRFRIEIDLVFLNKSANRGHFRNPFSR